jgi:hypothetical protein
MDEMLKTDQNGQWELLEKKDLAQTEVTAHFSDGTKKKFPYKHMAVSHLMANGHLPHDNSYTTFHHESDMSERKQTVRLETPRTRREMRQKRRESDK